jgi:hypothetical protein
MKVVTVFLHRLIDSRLLATLPQRMSTAAVKQLHRGIS